MNEKQKDIITFFNQLNIFNQRGNLGSVNKLQDYMLYLFNDINLNGKKVLDVGSGYGLYSGFMAAGNAKIVDSVEPELEGGTKKMIETINKIKNRFSLDNIEVITKIFQDLKTDKKYDIILMHNCINHLNEDMCITLKKNLDAKKTYLGYFKKIHDLLEKEGIIIITDSLRSNFFNKIGLANPFAPSIEYHKHQNPDVWINIAQQSALELKQLDYGRMNLFGLFIGKLLPSHIAARFFGVGFKLVFERKSPSL